MGWGKILAGAVGGFLVGGPVGAIVGGVAGAGVSKAMDNTEEERARERRNVAKGHSEIQEQQEERRKKIHSDEKKRVVRQQKAVKSSEKVSDAINNYDQFTRNMQEHAQLIIAFMAVGFAAANADGEIKTEELSELKMFLKEVNQEQQELPKKVLLKLRKYKETPPTLKQAISEVKKVPNYDCSMFRKLIECIVMSDGEISESEKQFIAEWDKAFEE